MLDKRQSPHTYLASYATWSGTNSAYNRRPTHDQSNAKIQVFFCEICVKQGVLVLGLIPFLRGKNVT